MTKHLLLLLFFPAMLNAQLENVVIETYYISDANDATDTMGGVLEAGSKTYRIYIDLVPGSKLKKLYGDANHALKFSSSTVFFNNKEDGQTLAKDFSKNRYGDNTVALDTWLTLGQTTKTAAKTYFGVPKPADRDGSFIGGANNDGGSAAVTTGLLNNNDASCGLPLTTADGMDTMLTIPTNWASYGIVDLVSNEDSTIFGSLVPGTVFTSNNVAIQNSGVMGVIAAENKILVAQLTTKGEIAFELNIEVEDTNGGSIIYVGNADTLVGDEKASLKLKYPPACGCTSPDYLEYSPNFACPNNDSCRTLVILGCTDPAACNYDARANFAVPALCCYPGACQDRDISLVCPTLTIGDEKQTGIIQLYPNPAEDKLTMKIAAFGKEAQCGIYDLTGRKVLEYNLNVNAGGTEIDISQLASGAYVFRLTVNGTTGTSLFVKN